MTTTDEVKKQNKKIKKINVLLVSGGLLLSALVILAAVLLIQMRQQKNEDTHAVSERIIRKVSELYILPSGETPTVAKIKDRSGLQGNQEFYADAQNGDYVLIYQKDKTALLYRESINKLVKVSPVTTPPSPQ